MARKLRRRESDDDNDTPAGGADDSRSTPAVRAYRCAVYSLIPIMGLVLGLLAIVLAVMTWREAHRDTTTKESSYVRTALALGLVTLLCNAGGLLMMFMAFTGHG
jgi:hypothetical protein